MVTLRGKKVLLRPTKESDLPLFLKWFNNPEVTKWLMWRDEQPMTEEFEKKWIAELPTRKDWLDFVIEATEGKTTKPIGNCAIHDINLRDRSAGLGINIGETDYWSKGYGTETVQLLLDYAFKQLQLRRIESRTLEFNERSIGLLKKLGYKKEGRLRKAKFKDGRFWDVLVFGLLREEWEKPKKSKS
jgi:RimJ/RimL family protein N-acetyltransferase